MWDAMTSVMDFVLIGLYLFLSYLFLKTSIFIYKENKKGERYFNLLFDWKHSGKLELFLAIGGLGVIGILFLYFAIKTAMGMF